MRLIVSVLALASLALLSRPVVSQDTVDGAERIVAVGDVHGDYDQFVLVLQQAGLIDGKGKWIGGRTHFVQTGDVLDRGPDSRKVMELLMALEPQAKKAGGAVHALIGNHEAMNILGDLRYVSAGEYAAFKGSNSAAQQERAWAVLSDSTRRKDPEYKKAWLAEHPLGWLEHRLAFEGNGRYGTWIRGHEAVMKVNDFLFMHGGISSKYASTPLKAINDAVRAALAGDKQPPPDNAAEDSLGPLWYRGLAQGDEALLMPLVDSVLASFGVRHIVIGHTVTAGTVLPRFDGKVIMIDVGLSAYYGAQTAFLVVEGGKAYTMHRGKKLEFPMNDAALLDYLKAAAALDPQPSKLQKYIDQLAAVKGG